MEIRAFAYSIDYNNYITTDDGKLKIFYIKEVVNELLRRPDAFDHIDFMSTNPDQDARIKLIPKKIHGVDQFVRIEHDNMVIPQKNETKYGIVEALSRIIVMTLETNKETFKFNLESITKGSKLLFCNKKIYYPDLICTFPETHELYEKWGGRFIILINYHNHYKPDMLSDYESYNIPVFVIDIDIDSDKIFPQERSNIESYTQEDVDIYIDRLYSHFVKKINSRLLIDPSSTKYSKYIIKTKEDEIKDKDNIIFGLNQRITSTDNKLLKLKEIENELNTTVDLAMVLKGKLSFIEADNLRYIDINRQLSLEKDVQKRKIASLHQKYNDCESKLDLFRLISISLIIFVFLLIILLVLYII
ncbi:hypothetical protein ACPV34_12595 [Photobacterium damselae]|uniref:hypothetical protein n=1 Tax=Photobacterium damselae TaxID=38293 RepID=UPI0040689662